MKIIELKAQNIKNLKAVEISPDGNIVTITGKNGAGKSAILDAIYAGLTGAKLEDIVRHGQEKGEVEINLGDYTVRRVYSGASDRLELKSPDGAKYSSPQGKLDALVGKLAFDPLSFAGMKPAEQREFLMKMVGLDFTDEDATIKECYNARTDANREVTKLAAQLGPEGINAETPTEELSIAAQIEAINRLRSIKAANDEILAIQKRKREEREQRFFLMQESIEKKTQEQQQLIQQREAISERIKEIDEEIKAIINKKETEEKEPFAEAAIVTPVSQEQIDAATNELTVIEQKNKEIREVNKRRAIAKQLEDAKAQSEALTAAIKATTQDKINKIVGATYPIAGLLVGDDSVLFKDSQGHPIPLQRLSTGQQIKVSTAIAMALNPKLKVILIRDGSLLDSDGLKAIQEMAQEKDYQIWLEKVENGEGSGIYIEDGEIKK